MKRIKLWIIVFTMVLTMISPVCLPFAGNVAVAEAATIKISKKTLKLEVGKTQVLQITGTKTR